MLNGSEGSATLYYLVRKELPHDPLDRHFESARDHFRNQSDESIHWHEYPVAWHRAVSTPSEIKGLEQEWETYSLCSVTDPALRAGMMAKDRDPFTTGFVW